MPDASTKTGSICMVYSSVLSHERPLLFAPLRVLPTVTEASPFVLRYEVLETVMIVFVEFSTLTEYVALKSGLTVLSLSASNT